MKLNALALMAILAGSGPAALAQSQSGVQPEPRYGIEVLVFRHLDQSRNTPEISLPQVLAAPPAFGDEAAQRDPNADRDPQMLAAGRFAPMREQDLKLDGVYRRLLQLDAYQPLSQMAWVQSVPPKLSAEPYVVPLTVTDRSGLAGSVVVYKQRYLHVALDLTLSLAGAQGGSVLPGEVAVLKESRRVRGTNYQYFDHPQFGAIVAVSRLAGESEQASDSGPDAAAALADRPAGQ